MHKRKMIAILTAFLLAVPFSSIQTKAEDQMPAVVDDGSLISDYAYAVDIDSGQVLVDKNPDDIIYPASLTKMMTCIVAMENLTDLNQRVTITDEMLKGLYEASASVAGFKTGDQPTVEDLFYCSALPSGADASNALAMTTSGSIESYVERMNQKAADIGMDHTHFVNVTGLHDPDHYSTASDMVKLIRYCIQNEEFVKVFSSEKYTTTALASAPNGLLVYSTAAIYKANSGFTLKGMIGSKTGFTDEAERCFAYWAEVNGIRVAAVSAHAEQTPEHWWPHIEDAETVLDSLASWKKEQVVEQGQLLDTISVHNMFSDDEEITVNSPSSIVIDMPETDQAAVEVDLPSETASSYDEETVNGTMQIKLNGTAVSTDSLSASIPADPNFFARLLKRIRSFFTSLFS